MELHVELLLGKRVVDADDHLVGRIEELRAEDREDAAYVTHYLVGPYAVLERLSASGIGRALARMLPRNRALKSYAIPWDKLDLSNPDHPRLTCRRSELAAFQM